MGISRALPTYITPNGATLVDDGPWYGITPTAPFTATNNSRYPVRYIESANGVVYLDGLVTITSGSWGSKILQMPGHLYPDFDRYGGCFGHLTAGGYVPVRMLCNTTGAVTADSGEAIGNIDYIELGMFFYHL